MISVVIPTLNEAANLARLLAALAREETPHAVVVADGGSGDRTVAIACASGARVVEGARGRGAQLRAGAAAAAGEVLLFLHVDSLFPAGGLARIAEVLASTPAIVGGNFRLVFDGATGFSRWLTGFYTKEH